MLKKIILCSLLVTLIGVAINDPSYAGLFKRYKSDKKQTTEENIPNQERKILLIEIFASWCPGCKNIQPTLDQLVKENADIELIQLDVSTPSKAKESAKKAEEYEISDFYNLNKSKTSTVGIILPENSEIITQFQNNNDIEEYKTALQTARTKKQELDSKPAI